MLRESPQGAQHRPARRRANTKEEGYFTRLRDPWSISYSNAVHASATADGKKIFEGILRSGSPALYPHVNPQTALDALDYASTYNIESWDGYLISLARSLGSTVVYSLDKDLARVREITVVNPFPQNEVEQYHKFLESKIDHVT